MTAEQEGGEHEVIDHRPWIPLFDVDGVITNPETKQSHPLLLGYIANRLLSGAPVGLASTRDFAWVEENVINPIRGRFSADRLDNLFVSTEKSAVTTTYQNGEIHKEYDESLRVPQEIGDQLRVRIEDKGYSGVFYYPKETLFTAEIYGGDDPSILAEQNRQLDELFAYVQRELLPHGSPFKADRTHIAIDIYHSLGNKAISARRFITFLESRGFDPKSFRFITVGDGSTDLEMADGIRESGLDVEFGWVGRISLQDPRGHKVILPSSGETNDSGTVALLRQLGEFDRFSPGHAAFY